MNSITSGNKLSVDGSLTVTKTERTVHSCGRPSGGPSVRPSEAENSDAYRETPSSAEGCVTQNRWTRRTPFTAPSWSVGLGVWGLVCGPVMFTPHRPLNPHRPSIGPGLWTPGTRVLGPGRPTSLDRVVPPFPIASFGPSMGCLGAG